MELFWRFGIVWLITSAHTLNPEGARIKKNDGIYTVFNCDPNNKSVKFAVSPPKPHPGENVNVTVQFTPRFDLLMVSYTFEVLADHSIVFKTSATTCSVDGLYICGLRANSTVTYTKNDVTIPAMIPLWAHFVAKLLAYNQDDELVFCGEIHYDETGPAGFTKD